MVPDRRTLPAALLVVAGSISGSAGAVTGASEAAPGALALNHGPGVNAGTNAAWGGGRVKLREPLAPQLPARDLAPLTATSWLIGQEAQGYRLPSWTQAPLLERFVNPAVERHHPADEYWLGRFGQRALRSDLRLVWNDPRALLPEDDLSSPDDLRALLTPEEAQAELLALTESAPLAAPWPSLTAAPTSAWFEPLEGPGLTAAAPWYGPEVFPTWALTAPPAPEGPFASAPLRAPCPAWAQAPRAVAIGRYGAEYDRFVLLECDGSIAPEALDRLSVMARPPGSPRPELPLPPYPDPTAAEHGEWLDGVRLLHPRVVWLVNKLALAFPGRSVYLISGYRKDSHSSLHSKGRALDLFIQGVPNEDLFKYCRKLKDVGCGYYPNHPFVHVDVRPFGSGHPFWIDDSAPGQPSRYVDSWPGVAESGGLSWGG
ncbi:MAG: DUF882 domain-containing protein [Polyangiaceae bacterium]|nr:DUF882 domain-containing protein [Polyangiaceae bacterium]MCW5790654.1 DUF882 domain-containing protein [Polyangiaceae bacterium]